MDCHQTTYKAYWKSLCFTNFETKKQWHASQDLALPDESDYFISVPLELKKSSRKILEWGLMLGCLLQRSFWTFPEIAWFQLEIWNAKLCNGSHTIVLSAKILAFIRWASGIFIALPQDGRRVDERSWKLDAFVRNPKLAVMAQRILLFSGELLVFP